MAKDRITHAIHFLSAAIKDVPNSIRNYQLAAIEDVRAIFENWQKVEPLPPIYPTAVPPPKPTVPWPKPSLLRYPAPTSKGDH